MASRRVRLLIAVLLSLGGLALLVDQIRGVGLAALGERLTQVGWGFAGILALSFARMACRSIAWRSLMHTPAPLWTAIAATIAGDAVGNVTVFNLAASEPTKAIFVGGRDGRSRAFAALTAENFFYSVSVALYIVFGTAAMLVAFADNLSPQLRRAGVAALLLMAAVLAGAAWLAWQRPSLLGGLLARLPVSRLSGLAGRVRQFEAEAYESAGGRRSGLATVVLCDLVFHALSFAETWLTLWLLTGVNAPLAAFVLDTANRVVNVVFRMIPLRAGVDEVTSEAVALAVGVVPGVGVAMGLVRKARVLTWALVGFALLVARTRASGAAAPATSPADPPSPSPS